MTTEDPTTTTPLSGLLTPKPFKPPAIYASLAAVSQEVGAVKKTGWNTNQNFAFRGIDAVVNAVQPVLVKHGVIVYPTVKSARYEDVLTSQSKRSTACRVRVTYTFVDSSDGSSVMAKVVGEAWDTSDKATTKAMSVAFRTALLQTLCLPTDEPDPDSFSYEKGVARVTDEQLAMMNDLFNQNKMAVYADRLEYIKSETGRKNIVAPGDMTEDEGTAVNTALQAMLTLGQTSAILDRGTGKEVATP